MTLDQILMHSYQAGDIYAGWITTALQVGGTLLGGLLGRKKKQTEETITDQTSTSTTDLVGMSEEAVRAGFNPLTALRAGVAGGFVTTRTQGKNVTTSSGGGGGVGAAIGDAMVQAGALFGQYNQPKASPISVRNKDTGIISRALNAQLGSTRRPGSVVVAPRQTTVTSPRSVTAPVSLRGNPPIPGLMPTLPRKAGEDRYVRIYDHVLGRDTMSVSPDTPDFDQIMGAVAETYGNYVYDAFQKSKKAVEEQARGGLIKSRPLTDAERAAHEGSWHRGWLPSFRFNWK